MKHIAQTIAEEFIVHYDGPWGEFALCGDEILGTVDLEMSPGEKTDKPVTCSRCLDVVRHVRGQEMKF